MLYLFCVTDAGPLCPSPAQTLITLSLEDTTVPCLVLPSAHHDTASAHSSKGTSVCLEQSFITLCCLEVSCVWSLHWIFSCLSVSSDNQKRVQGLPNILEGRDSPWCFEDIMSLNWTLKALRVLIKLSFTRSLPSVFPLLFYYTAASKHTRLPLSPCLCMPFSMLDGGVSFSLFCLLKKNLLRSQV